MSDDEQPSYIDKKLADFTDRFTKALEQEREERKQWQAKQDAEREQERKEREQERKEQAQKREQERKEREQERKEQAQEREQERKEQAQKREQERKEVAVEMGRLRDMWGQLAEFVIESGILETLNRHGDLNVNNTLPNVEVRRPGEDGRPRNGEIDIIVSGPRDIVIVETKTTLTTSDVSHFINTYLRGFSRWEASSPYITLPSCEGMRVFGCLAYMKAGDKEAEDVAVREGLITVHAFGDSSDLAHPDTVLIDYHPDRYRAST